MRWIIVVLVCSCIHLSAGVAVPQAELPDPPVNRSTLESGPELEGMEREEQELEEIGRQLDNPMTSI